MYREDIKKIHKSLNKLSTSSYERLRKEYGDYMKISNEPTAHGKVIFEPDIPYEEYLKKKEEK